MKKIFAFFVLILLVSACSDNHFIGDSDYRAGVEKKFEARKAFAENRADVLFNVFDQNLTVEETEALKFLYAYMPLCDLADYNGEFFLKQVRSSLKARETFSWGSEIPEEIFRHFVLPYRVNNENLDAARWVFFEELKDRIKNLTMKEAALEVNHWCHEKVTYRPNDIRTSGPLSTVRTSWGRCGEESTFTVTALRAVGIPARQVYSPRWAHCDDNHAWVEVYTDGKWSYLGACEPEPILNLAWFTEPARRAMLVHTKVFGDYTGNDEVVKRTDNYTEINVVSNYAEVKKIFVRVLNQNNDPVEAAKVDYGLYNYAEFYPIASKQTDTEGLSHLTTGLGDLLIWASKEGEYAYRKISAGDIDTLTLRLNDHVENVNVIDYDLHPPIKKTPVKIDAKLREENNARLKEEDRIRTAYTATFIDSITTAQFAEKINLEKSKTWQYLKKSWGNWREIKSFLDLNKDVKHEYLFALLNQISDKDLRDTRSDILTGHLLGTINNYNSKEYKSKKIFYSYVLNPRIKNEKLIDYREYFLEKFDGVITGDRKTISANVVKWINENITINETDNYYNLPITPVGVYELKISNKESRDVFFVAVMRSLGVPARLEMATKHPQYFNGKRWMNVYFETENQLQPNTGYLVLTPRKIPKGINPQYYMHFTIAKLIDGVYKTAEYDENWKLSDFPNKIKLETGSYRLITGNRKDDGTVFSRLSYFNIGKNKTTHVRFEVRIYENKPQIIGEIKTAYQLKHEAGNKTLGELIKNDMLIMGWIEPDKEPTKHALGNLIKLKDTFEKWDGNFVMIIPEEKQTASFNESVIKQLPSNIIIMEEKEDAILSAVQKQLALGSNIDYPFIIVVNKNGEIIFSSQGYRIGIGEQLLKRVN